MSLKTVGTSSTHSLPLSPSLPLFPTLLSWLILELVKEGGKYSHTALSEASSEPVRGLELQLTCDSTTSQTSARYQQLAGPAPVEGA